jgi:hypothetical protein
MWQPKTKTNKKKKKKKRKMAKLEYSFTRCLVFETNLFAKNGMEWNVLV